MAFHPSGAAVPETRRTERLLLRPLRASDVERDYDAVMESAEQLRLWSQSDWPAPEFTLEENLVDLVRHEREHLEGVAFTYTVLDPAGARCLGCVYVTPPVPELARLLPGAGHAAHVGFWVRTSELAGDLEAHLLATLRAWFAEDWAFDRVVFGSVRRNERQAALLEREGLTEVAAYTRANGRDCRAFG